MEEFWNGKVFLQLLASLVLVAVAVVLFIFIKRRGEKLFKRQMEKNKERATLVQVTSSALRVILVVVGVVLVLQINGVNVSAVMTGVGLISAIFALALQDLLKDIIMGMHIIADHFFSVGECVEYAGAEGVILSMSLKTTKIGRIDDHSVITVCNRNISEIRRLSERLDVDIPLPYSEDFRKVHRVLNTLCARINALPQIRKCEYKGTNDFAESAIMYKIRLYCEPRERDECRRAALRILQEGLEAESIHIPFNQLDVHCNIVNQ